MADTPSLNEKAVESSSSDGLSVARKQSLNEASPDSGETSPRSLHGFKVCQHSRNEPLIDLKQVTCVC